MPAERRRRIGPHGGERGGTPYPTERRDREVALIVDGLFGIGLARPLDRAATPRWIDGPTQPAYRSWRSTFRAGSTPTPASRTARRSAPTATATFIALKPGLLTGDGVDHCGDDHVHRARPRRERHAPATAGHRLDWTALRRCAAGSALHVAPQRAQGNVRHARRSSAARRDGRRAAARRRAALHPAPARCWSASPRHDAPAVDWRQPELMLRSADAVLDRRRRARLGPGLGTGARARHLRRRAPRAGRSAGARRRRAQLVAADPALRAAVRARRAPTIADAASGRSGAPAGVTTSRHPGATGSAPRMTLARELDAARRAQRRGQRAGASRRHAGTSTPAASRRSRPPAPATCCAGIARRVARARHRRRRCAAPRRVPARRRGRRAGGAGHRAARPDRIRACRRRARRLLNDAARAAEPAAYDPRLGQQHRRAGRLARFERAMRLRRRP